MTDHSEYTMSLSESELEFNDAVNNLATKFRTEVIIPLCKKHELQYVSGMGLYFFTNKEYQNLDSDPDGNIVVDNDSDASIDESLREELESVFEVLDAEVFNQVFGYYVEQVSKTDLA